MRLVRGQNPFAQAVQVLTLGAAGGLEADHVYVIGLHAGVTMTAPERIPDSLISEELPPDSDASRHAALAQELYVALSRALDRLLGRA